MVVSQFVDNNPEENFEEPVDENPTASLDDNTELTDTIAPVALVEIPDDMLFEALVDNQEEVTTPVAEVPWLGAELETPSEDIPNQTEPPPYTFDEAQYVSVLSLILASSPNPQNGANFNLPLAKRAAFCVRISPAPTKILLPRWRRTFVETCYKIVPNECWSVHPSSSWC